MAKQILRLLLLYLTHVCVLAKVKCGLDVLAVTCYGSGAYCCGPRNDQCCWESYTVYSFWWFWFAWFWAFFLLVACTIWACIRRRRRLANQRQYVIVDQQPSYGAVAQPAWIYTDNQATPPATAPPYQEKPPPYEAQ